MRGAFDNPVVRDLLPPNTYVVTEAIRMARAALNSQREKQS